MRKIFLALILLTITLNAQTFNARTGSRGTYYNIDSLVIYYNIIDTLVQTEHDSIFVNDTTYVQESDTTAPVAVTYNAFNIGDSSGSARGIIIPNNSPTTVRFLWGTSSSALNDSSISDQSQPITKITIVSLEIDSLQPATKYYFKVSGTNAVGYHLSELDSFTTTEQIDVTPPGDISTLYIFNETNEVVTLNFSPPSDPDYSYAELWASINGVDFFKYDSIMTPINTYDFSGLQDAPEDSLSDPSATLSDAGNITNSTASIDATIFPGDSASHRFIWFKTDSVNVRDSSNLLQITSIYPVKLKHYFKMRPVDIYGNTGNFTDTVSTNPDNNKTVTYNIASLDSATDYSVIASLLENGAYSLSDDTTYFTTLGTALTYASGNFVPAQSADDAYWTHNSGTTFSNNASNLYVHRNSSGTFYESGIRFNNLNIPAGAVIDTAYIALKCSSNTGSSGTAFSTIWGELNPTPAVFSNRTEALARVRTTSNVNWVFGPWVVNTVYNSPEIKTIIQEIIDNPGWATNNELVLFIKHNTSPASELRNTYPYDAANTLPTLHIAWHVGNDNQEPDPPASGVIADYYIDNTLGSDSYDGMSPTVSGTSGPWKTIAKVNSSSFVPGDTIAFKKGEVWSGTPLLIKSSGTVGERIVFTSYGDDPDKPVITMRTDLPGWNTAGNWTQVSGDTIWRINISSATMDRKVTRMWLADTEYAVAHGYYLQGTLTKATERFGTVYQGDNLDNADGGATTYGVNRIHRFLNYPSKSGNYYVYTPTGGNNPANYYNDIELSTSINTTTGVVTKYTCGLQDADYVTVEKIEFRGGIIGIVTEGSNNVMFDSIKSTQSQEMGFYSANTGFLNGSVYSDGGELKNSIIDADYHCKFFFHLGDEILLSFGVALSEGAINWDVHHNVVSGWANNLFAQHREFQSGTTPYTPSRAEFYNNEVYAPDVTYAKGGQVNVITTGTNELSYVKYYNNYFHDLSSGINVCASKVDITYNRFSNLRWSTNDHASSSNSGYALQVTDGATGIGAPDSVTFSNNVVDSCDSYGVRANDTGGGTAMDVWVENNIFINNRTQYASNIKYHIYFRGSCATRINNNVIYQTGANGSTKLAQDRETSTGYSVTELNSIAEATGKETNNNLQHTTAVSNLVNTDFSLPVGSPAINAGIERSWYRATDYLGNDATVGTRDIGLKEKP